MEHKCKCTVPGRCPWYDTITSREELEACQHGIAPLDHNYRPCVYMHELQPRTIDGQPAYGCNLHGVCTRLSNKEAKPACSDCNDYMSIRDPNLAERFIDPLRVTDRTKQPTTALRNLLAGGSAFLVCGGPSLSSVEYNRLSERGVFSLGINNVA